MEAKAQEPGLGQATRDRLDLGEAVLDPMEGGVEAGDLRQLGPRRLDGGDAGEALRLMARGQRHQRLQLGDQAPVDAGGAGMAGAAMDDAMTHCPEVEVRNASQPGEEPADDGAEVARGRHVAFEVEVSRDRQMHGTADPGDVDAPERDVLVLPKQGAWQAGRARH